MTTKSPSTAERADAQLPLFYRELRPLSATAHGGWRLKDGDASFAADTPFVPIVVSELASAARSYPIVFSAGDAQPIAVLGLERANLFVTDGQWAEGAYLPAYVRRYPFGFIATVNPEGFALAIDGASDRVAREGEEGAPLFEDGKPSALTREAMEFCTAFGREVEITRLLANALNEKELLIDRRADATLSDGRKLGIEGFQIVDREKFAALDEETVVTWHRQGLLGLIHHHFASLDRFSDLLALQGKRAPVTATSQPDGSDADDSAPAQSTQSKKA